MSIKLMCSAFEADIPATQKLVLLALCDNANDQGHCFPSVSLLERKCSLSDRTVQTSISWLEKHGFLTRQFRTGRATLYVMTPEGASPPKDVHPRSSFTTPPKELPPTPEAASPLTVKEPSSNHQKNRGTRLDVDELPDDWQEFCRDKRPDLNAFEVFDSFKDYWVAQPGLKGVKVDWKATWRNWVRNQKKNIKPDWVVKKERADAAFNVMIGNQRSMSGDVIDIEEDKNDPFRLSFGN